MRLHVYTSPGWLGIRVGPWYLTLRDLRRHDLRFSERNRRGYRPIRRFGAHWELGVRS